MLVATLLFALATSPTPPTPPATANTTVPPPTSVTPPTRRWPLGPLGSGGVVVGSTGLGLAIAGIVRMSQPSSFMPDPSNHELLIVTDTRIQGSIVVGAGLAVVAAGVAMLAIDLTVLRRRYARRLFVTPTLLSTTVGLDLRARFSLRRVWLP
jgi:hypothetical protein